MTKERIREDLLKIEAPLSYVQHEPLGQVVFVFPNKKRRNY